MLTIRKSAISETRDALRKDILAYVSYPRTSSRCFVVPQYVVDGLDFTPIANSAFPDNGSFSLAVSGGRSVLDIEDSYGSVVVLTLNMNYEDDFQDNIHYNPASPNGDCQLHTVIDPTRMRGGSLAEFTRFSSHRLSSQLATVIEVEEWIDPAVPGDFEVHFDTQMMVPSTKHVVISQANNGSRGYYGPFKYESLEADSLVLSASPDYNYRVASIPSGALPRPLDLFTTYGEVHARFVSEVDIASVIPTVTTYDWVTDEELIALLGKIVQRSKDLNFTKADIRNLKSALASFQSSEDLEMDEARRQKLMGMLGDYESWSELPDVVKAEGVRAIPDDQLAEYVLSNEHFSEFYNRAMEHERVREKVQAKHVQLERQFNIYAREVKSERDRLDAEIQGKQAAVRQLGLEIEQKRADSERIAREAKEESERVAREAMAQKRVEYDELTGKVARAKHELSSLHEEIEAARSERDQLDDTVRDVYDAFSDETAVAGRLLESKLLERIASHFGGRDATAAPAPDRGRLDGPAAAPRSFALANEASLEPLDVVDRLYDYVTEVGGRDCSCNDVINYFICLTQGYITTFAGLPGTGKTSLVNILAGALGLRNPQVQRFAEVPVERGWTSHTDFIGYYNPLSKRIEKSNASVFDAFAEMDAEARDGVGGVPPYLLLLDEANLSSLEHYWAPFLRICDSYYEGAKSLSIGDASMRVPPYLRFMATVNFDHTTEELSPRFLDRSWVITLDPQVMDFDSDFAVYDSDFSNILPLSYEKLNSTFGVSSVTGADPKIDSATQDLYGKILTLCQEHALPVSPRSQKMMRNYIDVAFTLMDTSSNDCKFAPLDFAVSQKILPTISGPAERLEGFLDKLVEVVAPLPITSRHLKRMKNIGDLNGFYQYFV